MVSHVKLSGTFEIEDNDNPPGMRDRAIHMTAEVPFQELAEANPDENAAFNRAEVSEATGQLMRMASLGLSPGFKIEEVTADLFQVKDYSGKKLVAMKVVVSAKHMEMTAGGVPDGR